MGQVDVVNLEADLVKLNKQLRCINSILSRSQRGTQALLEFRSNAAVLVESISKLQAEIKTAKVLAEEKLVMEAKKRALINRQLAVNASIRMKASQTQ